MSHTGLIIKGVTDMLKGLEFDEHLHCEGTPERVARMWEKLVHGIPEPNYTLCPYDYRVDFVMLRNHITWGFCPHHLLPVKYNISIAYVPDDKVFGASKPLRIADYIASKLPLQEDIPGKIADIFMRELHPRGFACIVQGEHACMRMRGVESPCCDMVTPLFLGELKDEPLRNTFLHNIDCMKG